MEHLQKIQGGGDVKTMSVKNDRPKILIATDSPSIDTGMG